jgi:hypothetical protein
VKQHQRFSSRIVDLVDIDHRAHVHSDRALEDDQARATRERGTSVYTDTQRLLAYLESELGNVLTVDPTNKSYGAISARNGSATLSGQTLAQIGRHAATVHKPVIDLTTEPINKTAPVATGTGTAGQTLSVTNGAWKSTVDNLAFTYQWQRAGVNIGGATASTYLLVAGDSTHTISCVVSATDAANDATSQASNGIAVA